MCPPFTSMFSYFVPLDNVTFARVFIGSDQLSFMLKVNLVRKTLVCVVVPCMLVLLRTTSKQLFEASGYKPSSSLKSTLRVYVPGL